MLATLFSAITVLLLLSVALLLWWSYPGRPQPLLDQHGKPLPDSISEKVFIDLNGVRQGMFIQSKDVRNPVLLFLHGGMPFYFYTQNHPTGLEDLFTVVWWEQRGAGISYDASVPFDSLNVEQFIADTLELTNHLRRRFGKEKIYLMAHSGGSFFGIQAAARAPSLFHAYIGVGQISNQLESERRAQQFMIEQFEQRADATMVQKLRAAPITLNGAIPNDYLAIRDSAMHSLGVGTTREMKSVITGIFLPSLQFRQYTVAEKINLWRGKIKSGVSVLWGKIVTTDLSEQTFTLDLPIYFFHGIHDYTCSYPLAKRYFAKIAAPRKGFYTFAASAHSPIFEEPEKARRILQDDVLRGRNDATDK